MFLQGFGVPSHVPQSERDQKALELYKRAADLEDSLAYSKLGKAHMDGLLGLAQDRAEAESLLTKSLKGGIPSSWYFLGRLALRAGDEKKAAKMFHVGVQKGHALSAFELGLLQLKERKSCNEAVHNFALVFEWSEIVVRKLNQAFRAYTVLGNATQALEIYEQLAWTGIEEAQANAAFLLDQVLQEPERAKVYYELSAEHGSAHSHLKLGDYYYRTGQLNTSHTAYRRASDLFSHEAMYNLGYMYEHGEGVPAPDWHLAKRFYDLAAVTNPSSIYAVYLSLLHLYWSSSSALFANVNLFWWWSDTLALTCLSMLFGLLVIVKFR